MAFRFYNVYFIEGLIYDMRVFNREERGWTNLVHIKISSAFFLFRPA
jgi:hypothetical protein